MANTSEYDALLREINDLRERVMHVTLENSIHNRTDSPRPIKDMEKYFFFPFYSDYLCLAVVNAHADPNNRHTSPLSNNIDPLDTPDESMGIIYYTPDALEYIESTCSRFLSPRTHYHVFRADKSVGILLNPDAQLVSDAHIQSGNYLDEIREAFKEITDALDSQLQFENVVSISGIHSSPTRIRDLYLEALDTYDYSWNRNESVVTYADLKASPMSLTEEIELQSLEREFSNDVAQLLFYEASLVLDQIMQKQFSHAIPLSDITLSVTARLRHVLALIAISPEMKNVDIAEIHELHRKLSSSVSVPELQDRVRDFFALLADYNPRQNVKKIVLILDYIDSNSKDPQLSAQMICDRFHISQTYLSRLIKKETGQGLVDCIHSCRIKNAKYMLRETNLSIEQIALQVGFSNRYGLIRAFRSTEDMTPTDYRKRFQPDSPDEFEN